MRNGSYTYNNNPSKAVLPTQCAAGPCMLIKKEAYHAIHFQDERWLESFKYPLGEDLLFYYKLHVMGYNVVVHYTAGEKPWHKDCKHPLKAEYDNYMHLHTVLLEKKMPGHRWYFYVIEGIIDKLRSIYQWYRSKNGMVVNKA